MWRSCKCRIILILGGLIIGIMLLETSLRFAALIYSSDKLHNTKLFLNKIQIVLLKYCVLVILLLLVQARIEVIHIRSSYKEY